MGGQKAVRTGSGMMADGEREGINKLNKLLSNGYRVVISNTVGDGVEYVLEKYEKEDKDKC